MEFPHAGQTFQAKYKLLEVLGRGGFAAVYKAIDVEIGREVAIKILVPTDGGYDSGLVARFLREARVVAQLRDPHTITMFDFGRTDEGLLFMVFEYVAGADLANVLEKGPLAEATTTHLLQQLLQALREAHDAGVLHRDIKPANVLIYSYMDDPWRVKLLDFGIAKPGIGKDADPVATLTKAGGIIGTPRYMSPEQLCGDELHPSTDMYSLGLVAYEMLMGTPAIDGRDTRDNLRLQLSERPLVFPAGAPVSDPMRWFVERMMSREPESRFQSAKQALDALNSLHGPIPTGQHRPVTGPARRVTSQNFSAIRTPSASRIAPLEPKKSLGDRVRALPTAALVGLGAIVGAAVVVPIIGVLRNRAEPVVEPAPVRVDNGLVRRTAPDPTAPDPAPDQVAEEEDMSSDAAADVGPSATGCGKPATPGEQVHRRTVGLAPRAWMTVVPKSYDPNTPAPILMLVHDRTRSSQRVIADMEFGPLADKHGYIIVAPEGSDYNQPWNPAQDLDFIQAILRQTANELCVDRSRLYAVGHNYGGAAVERLACLMPFSAIATTAFRGSGEVPCDFTNPVPHIHIVGRDNLYFPLGGGPTCDAGATVSLREKENAWFAANRCKGPRKTYAKVPTGVCETLETCEAAFVSCVAEGGRDWPKSAPRGLQLPNCKVPPGQFPYTQTIWDFFANKARVLEVPE